ncbi:MAG: hypothetical protein HY805_05835 [Nitrospirae bacterium]|nr:hypothetical protein [Nitrospirota bacterium]
MKKTLAILLVMLLASTVAFAGDKGDKDFWSNLKGKIEKVTPKGSQGTTAVGGVRGAKDEGESLYWKGKAPEVSKEELESFNSALDSAIKGQKTDAIAKFEAFLKKYPSSALAVDAKESLKKLRE